MSNGMKGKLGHSLSRRRHCEIAAKLRKVPREAIQFDNYFVEGNYWGRRPAGELYTKAKLTEHHGAQPSQTFLRTGEKVSVRRIGE